MQEIFLERGECPEVVPLVCTYWDLNTFTFSKEASIAVFRIPTAVPRQSLIYWSSRLKDYVRVEEDPEGIGRERERERKKERKKGRKKERKKERAPFV